MESIHQHNLKWDFNWVQKIWVHLILINYTSASVNTTHPSALIKSEHQTMPSVLTFAKKNLCKFFIAEVFIFILSIKFHINAFYVFLLMHLKLFSALKNIACKRNCALIIFVNVLVSFKNIMPSCSYQWYRPPILFLENSDVFCICVH